MQLFVVDYLAGTRGCPMIMKGERSRDWQWEAYDPKPELLSIDGEYEYQWKSPLIDFDYWSSSMIASAAFADTCDTFRARTRRVPLKIVQSNGRSTSKSYCYLLWSDWLSILDFDHSEYQVDRDLVTGEPIMNRYFPEVAVCESITRFVPDQSKVRGKSIFRCIDIGDETVCDATFMQTCIDKGFVGLRFLPIDQYQLVPFWR